MFTEALHGTFAGIPGRDLGANTWRACAPHSGASSEAVVEVTFWS
jgi:hypothetical protein